MRQDSMDLFLQQERFDLIFKYLYAKDPCPFNKMAYLESIRAFNGYFELNPSDGVPKNSAEDFIGSYEKLIKSIQDNQFKDNLPPVPIGRNGEITDGAHRLSACAAFGCPICVCIDSDNSESYPYSFFRRKGMNEKVMDYGALKYVELNPNSYIVNLHSVTNPEKDTEVETILRKYGKIYYKKNVNLTFNGCVNLKRISYGSFWESDSSWIGNQDNHYIGAQRHAEKSFGRFPLRVYVFCCDSIEDVRIAKEKIREIYGIGNHSVHINDTHTEAEWLAKTYFNENSLHLLNTRPFDFDDIAFDKEVDGFVKAVNSNRADINLVCCAGSTPLNIYGKRHSSDIDYLSIDDKFNISNVVYSPHDDQLVYYPKEKEDIITNPEYHLYYRGVKFISLPILLGMKRKRGEYPKDYKDIRLIKQLMNNHLRFATRIDVGKQRQMLKSTPILGEVYRALAAIKHLIIK